jgi:hypothetical protein
VEGSSRLARICCHSSGRLWLSGADSVPAGGVGAGGVGAGSELTTGCGFVLGRLMGAAAGAVLVTAAVTMAGGLTTGGWPA